MPFKSNVFSIKEVNYMLLGGGGSCRKIGLCVNNTVQLELERAWHNRTTISRKIYSLVIHSHLKTQEHLSSLDMTTDLEESDCFGKISKHFILFDNLPRSPILLCDAQHKMQFILVLCFVCKTAEISRIVV